MRVPAMLKQSNPYKVLCKVEKQPSNSITEVSVYVDDVVVSYRLHVLELVDAPLGVPLADLAQRLVLVAALADVLAVDLVHGRLFRLVAGLREVLFQRLWGQIALC